MGVVLGSRSQSTGLVMDSGGCWLSEARKSAPTGQRTRRVWSKHPSPSGLLWVCGKTPSSAVDASHVWPGHLRSLWPGGPHGLRAPAPPGQRPHRSETQSCPRVRDLRPAGDRRAKQLMAKPCGGREAELDSGDARHRGGPASGTARASVGQPGAGGSTSRS